ncbi:sulfatase-like hydrolase/transferase [Sinorhizobium sp. 6-70]|nr:MULTISPECIES: sulfatase-like hydrolase/transferase [unclassified Sinorhizobium]MDK1374536.1 sulfatase-like hydrolase/transferase [Sinorhizobium sp. 6-70]MDK1478265.1 sulfatase-like hydrolase/transferase [Sinorhizobium sp. 6-117]
MKNLLFIDVDQLRWDCFAPRKTVPVKIPNLDRLIESGVSFDRAYCTSLLCAPSRAFDVRRHKGRARKHGLRH